jgi:N-terminal acetyltransferase B complex non-catalytic subunit
LKDDAVPLTNAYKLQYHDQIAGHSKASKSSVDIFIRKCIEHYDSFTSAAKAQYAAAEKAGNGAPPMESRPTDDFCIIAAMTIVRANQVGEIPSKVSNTALIRAAGVLEQLLIDSPHNSDAILILIRIYLLLGAGSIALKKFTTLSVKHMQYESVAHNLFTRFATIHPHSGPPIEGADYKEFDPQALFVKALDFFRGSNITIGHSLAKGLGDGTYVNLEDSIELRTRLKDSICRKMWALEIRRMQRLRRGEHLNHHGDVGMYLLNMLCLNNVNANSLTAQNTSPAQDNRKYDAFMNLERYDQPTFEQRLRAGPLPTVSISTGMFERQQLIPVQESWLSSARVTDRLFNILANLGLQIPVDLTLELPVINDLSLSEAETDQTAAEKDVNKIHLELLKVALFMAGSKAHTTAQIESALGAVEDWLKTKKQSLTLNENKKSAFLAETAIEFVPGTPGAPTWEYFHAIWTLLETLKAIWKVTDLDSRKAIKTAKLPSDPLKRLHTLVCEVFEDVRANTRALKQGLSESATLSTLIDLINQGEPADAYEKSLQDVLGRAIDDSALEVFCGELRESWEEALDGVLGAKL